ncbi:hypothetical protein N5J31_01895 [Acinetobacter johnsonii]|uniref:hypothetical protein n=1 Tax=Acinetobacter johnsonii TaxID=40214 RepID=UPI00244A0D3A|nr:hypothetical protein [Acinetobacter johnsonii]MDH2045680.1 hypothetical protein [Acinetobacter johnsonii]
MGQTPNEFYADRGLVRTSITLTPEAIDILGAKAKELTDDKYSKVTQGEIVTILVDIWTTGVIDQEFNARLEQLKADKINARNERLERSRKAKELLKSGKLDHLLEE